MKEGRKERKKHPHLWHLLKRSFLFFEKKETVKGEKERKKETPSPSALAVKKMSFG